MPSLFHFLLHGIIDIINFVASLRNFYFYPRIAVIGRINEYVVRLIDVRKRVIGFEVYQSYFVNFVPIQLILRVKSRIKTRLVIAYYNLKRRFVLRVFAIFSKSSTSIFLGNKKVIEPFPIFSSIFFTG